MGEASAPGPRHDRGLLLLGPLRNRVLSLEEVERYGRDSFGNADHVSIYGLRPAEWYGRGIRILGRTAVECTRDVLGDAIGREVALEVGRLSPVRRILVLDPFAGSCNTLHWLLRHLPSAAGLAFEMDSMVFELAGRNLALLGRPIELVHGGYQTLLAERAIPGGPALVVFVAPPWGTALDEREGLDLARTVPPVTEIIDRIVGNFPERSLLFAIQIHEKVEPGSLEEVQRRLDRTRMQVFELDAPGRNHGIILGTRAWPAPST